MVIWVVMFFIIISISLFLAFRSMRDYSLIPVHTDTHYSLYLIKNEAGITEKMLESIDKIINQKRLIVSFERLFKGSKQALVVYGPEPILKQYAEILDLVELEDYSLKYTKPIPFGILAWEISSKDFHKPANEEDGQKQPVLDLNLPSITSNLSETDELWWQLVIQPKCEKHGLQSTFKALIRVVVITSDHGQAEVLKARLDHLVKQTNLAVVPQVFSSDQMVKHYQKRSLPQHLLDKEGGHFIIGIDDIEGLLR